jgi:hypothetical protein
MDLPAHVDKRLREEFRCTIDPNGPIGVLYRTPDEPHQPTLFAEPEYKIVAGKPTIGAVYVTRFQKERWSNKDQAYPTVDAEFLKQPEFSHASVLHPLPRVGELDVSVDSDSRAIYFQQAAYGVPIRMALISLLLGLRKGKSLSRFAGGFDRDRLPIYDQPKDEGLQCANPNCIVHDLSERPYVRNKFALIKLSATQKLRCAYCETDVEEFVIASKRNKWFTPDIASFLRVNGEYFRDFLAFSSASDAHAAGFHLRKHFAPQPRLERAKVRARGG